MKKITPVNSVRSFRNGNGTLPKNGKTPKKRVEKQKSEDTPQTLALKQEFGSKLEFFRERIAQDPSITIDLKIMNDLVNIFGIKKFYQMELDSDWAKRIRRTGQKYQCTECLKEYNSELGCKYHVKGKCPKNIAQYKCIICPEAQVEASRIEFHIRTEHLGETLGAFKTRGPSLASRHWSINDNVIIESRKCTKHRVPSKFELEKHTPFLSSTKIPTLETGSAYRRLPIIDIKLKKSRKMELKSLSAEAVEPNTFLLDTVYNVKHLCWLRVGNSDGICVATEQPGNQSNLQIWSFSESLSQESISPPKLIYCINCPYEINELAQVTSLDEKGFLALACSDGHIRIAKLGLSKNKIVADFSDIIYLRIGVNKKLRTWVSSIDVFEDWLVAGYGSGDVAIFRVRENDTNQYPFYSFNAHSRPVSSVQFHPSDVDRITTSGFDRVTKIWNRRGECIFTTGSSPTHLIRSSTWVGDGLMLGSENVFQDHVGVVYYDPTYNDAKFSLVVGNRSCVNSVDYCYLHGTLAFCDDLGRAVILSLQNPRRQLNMSRKGFTSKYLTKMTVKNESESNQYSVCLENNTDLSKIHDSKKDEKFDVKKTRPIEHSSILGANCIQWNHFGTARSCWIAVGLKSGLLQIFDVSGLRTHSSKPNRILSRLQFKAECQKLSKESVASS